MKLNRRQLRRLIESHINESWLMDQAKAGLKKKLAVPFDNHGYDGEMWSGKIVTSLEDAGFEEKLKPGKILGLASDSSTKNKIKSILNFHPRDIVEADDPDAEVRKIGADVLVVLEDTGYAHSDDAPRSRGGADVAELVSGLFDLMGNMVEDSGTPHSGQESGRPGGHKRWNLR